MRIKKKNLNRNRSPNWKTASLLKSRDSYANRAPKMSPVKSLNTHSPITAAVLRGPVTRKTEHWARVKGNFRAFLATNVVVLDSASSSTSESGLENDSYLLISASLVNGEQIYAYCPFCKNYAKKTTTGRGICIHSSCSRVFCCLCRGTHGEGMCPNPKPITRKLFSPDKTKRSVRRL